MKVISSEIVEQTWKKIGALSAQEMQKMVDQMSKQQPFILVYLMAAGSDIFNQDERELLLYLGLVVWQIMLQGDSLPPQITEKILDEAEETNIKMLEYLEDESESNFIKIIQNIINTYPQPEVLKYVVEALIEEPEEECLIKNEHKGMMMIYLKTLIDCLNK